MWRASRISPFTVGTVDYTFWNLEYRMMNMNINKLVVDSTMCSKTNYSHYNPVNVPICSIIVALLRWLNWAKLNKLLYQILMKRVDEFVGENET